MEILENLNKIVVKLDEIFIEKMGLLVYLYMYVLVRTSIYLCRFSLFHFTFGTLKKTFLISQIFPTEFYYMELMKPDIFDARRLIFLIKLNENSLEF